jgi:NADH:ubiquinone oxidoreductase subunit 2 (subunit N)
LSKLDINKIKYFTVDKEYRKRTKNIFFLSLLSLGGLPPLLGFFPKMAVLRIIIETNFFSPLIFLILGSLLSLSYYLNLFFSSYISSTGNYKQRIYFIFDKGGLIARVRFRLLLIRGFIIVEVIIIYALTIFN